MFVSVYQVQVLESVGRHEAIVQLSASRIAGTYVFMFNFVELFKSSIVVLIQFL